MSKLLEQEIQAIKDRHGKAEEHKANLKAEKDWLSHRTKRLEILEAKIQALAAERERVKAEPFKPSRSRRHK